MDKLEELGEELRMVLSGRGARLLDSFLPLIVFLVANSFLGLNVALGGALGIAGVFALYRLARGQSLVYSLGGLGGVLLAAVFVRLSGTGAGFFLPGLISGALTVVGCVVSVALNKPLVAWTSYFARRWPLAWYWHPQVLPAYNEVTIAWGVAFAARLVVQYWFYQQEAIGALGTLSVLLGWPFTIVLLVSSYLYGLGRLRALQGPSVIEFKEGKSPPWEGQRRGF